jgi:hypothetical protein
MNNPILLILIVLIIILAFGGYAGRGAIYGNPVYTGGFGIVGLVVVVLLVLVLLGHL